jgi:small-conductance mechanosensitive channel
MKANDAYKPFSVLLFSALVLAVPGLSRATATDNETAITDDSTSDVAFHRAPVTVDGRVLFSLRGASSYPAEQRALAVSQRIENVAANSAYSADQLRQEITPNVTTIVVHDQPIVRLFDADAALEGMPRPILAEIDQHRIAEAITDYRRERHPQHLLMQSLRAGLATLILIIGVWGISALFRQVDRLARRHVKMAIDKFQTRVSYVIQASSLWSGLLGLLHLVKWISVIAAIYAYFAFVFDLYPWTRPLSLVLFKIFIDPVRRIGDGFLAAFPGLVFVMVVILVAQYALKTLRLFFGGIDEGRITWANFDPEWAWPTYKIVRLMVIVFAAVVAYPYIPGSGSEAFKGISLFIGLVFSLGSSSVISNLVAGYSMTYRRAFKVGDVIRVNDVMGVVAEIGLVVTRLRTPKNEDVILPNSDILNKIVTNYSTLAKKEGIILHTTAGIGYETPWRQVEAMLLLAAERTPGLLKYPSPYVLVKALGDFAITYEVNVYCGTPDRMPQLYTALHKNVVDLFNEYGIQIMTPAYVGDPESPKLVPKDQWFTAPAAKTEKVTAST